jgi:signal transduction histidine kinase
LLEGHGRVQEDAEARRYLTRIRENIARMAALIDDLLAFARCGRETLRREDLNMDALAREALQQVRAAYPGTDVEVTIEPLPEARGDVALIRQVWLNFLDNAVKYTTRVAQPRVVISGREEQDKVIFEISDNGVGFDSRDSDALFQVFHRLHGAEYPGTGVGLAIVQRIVSRHGGDVWGRSAPGQGSTFGFSLPLHELTTSDAQINAVTSGIE